MTVLMIVSSLKAQFGRDLLTLRPQLIPHGSYSPDVSAAESISLTVVTGQF
jgi:hypothetical protein